mgnify:CR=1 FL=1
MMCTSAHQGSSIFTSKRKQCMAYILAAILQTKNQIAKEWTTETHDKIVKHRDHLYTLHNVDNYHTLEDLKQERHSYYKSHW